MSIKALEPAGIFCEKQPKLTKYTSMKKTSGATGSIKVQ